VRRASAPSTKREKKEKELEQKPKEDVGGCSFTKRAPNPLDRFVLQKTWKRSRKGREKMRKKYTHPDRSLPYPKIPILERVVSEKQHI